MEKSGHGQLNLSQGDRYCDSRIVEIELCESWNLSPWFFYLTSRSFGRTRFKTIDTTKTTATTFAENTD